MLGRSVGYGPNPRECIDRVMDACRIALLGDHDLDAIVEAGGFLFGTEAAIFWTREQLEADEDRGGNQRRRDFLSALPRSYSDGAFLFVHGSPRNPLSEYVFPEDVYNRRKMARRSFNCIDGVLLSRTHARAWNHHRGFPVLCP